VASKSIVWCEYCNDETMVYCGEDTCMVCGNPVCGPYDDPVAEEDNSLDE
jgi:hypothetical protein